MTVAVAVVPARRRIWFAARGCGAFTADLEDSHATLLVASGELDIAVQVGGKVRDYAPLSLIV